MDRRALGGEFGLARFSNNSRIADTMNDSPALQFFESGRDSIRAVLDVFPSKHILASAYSCRAVVDSLSHSGPQNLTLVDIDSSLYPNIDQIADHLHYRKGDYSDLLFFLGNLWGTRYPVSLLEFLQQFRRSGGTVIEDLTHKLDSQPLADSDGWMCSTRKWFGTTGLAALNLFEETFVASSNKTYTPSSLSLRLFHMRLLNFVPRQSAFRKLIIEQLRHSDEMLGSNQMISVANRREIRRFRSQDWSQILASRYRNKSRLEGCLQPTSTISVLNPIAANMSVFPTTIKISSGQEALRTYLRRHNVFAANLWPLGHLKAFYPSAYSLSRSALTLPCDQRFNMDSSTRIADLINSYRLNEEKTTG